MKRAAAVPLSSVRGKNPSMPDWSDDVSQATPVNGSGSTVKVETRTFAFRFEPSFMPDGTIASPSAIHTQWMQKVKDGFGDQIRSVNNKYTQNLDWNSVHWSNQTVHAQQFNAHCKYFGGNSPTGNTRQGRQIAFITHKQQTTLSLYEIKHGRAYNLLKQPNVFLNEHHWSPSERELLALDLFPTSTLNIIQARAQATKHFRSYCFAGLNDPKLKIPKFELFMGSHKMTDNNRMAATKAYTVEGLKKDDAELIMKRITQVYDAETRMFIPFQWQRSKPKAFLTSIAYQNRLLQNQYTVVLKYIQDSQMFYLDDGIKSIEGV